jgi:hypothetical protein
MCPNLRAITARHSATLPLFLDLLDAIIPNYKDLQLMICVINTGMTATLTRWINTNAMELSGTLVPFIKYAETGPRRSEEVMAAQSSGLLSPFDWKAHST